VLVRSVRVYARAAGAAPVLLGPGVERFATSLLVGWAFAVAASAFFPLLVLGIWWRGLTMAGAAAGTLVGGSLASAAILFTIATQGDATAPPRLPATPLSQPPLWTIPPAFTLIVAGSA